MNSTKYFNSLKKLGRYQIAILVFAVALNFVVFYASTHIPFQKLTPTYKCTSETQKTAKTCTIEEFCSNSTVKIRDEENKMVNWFVDFQLNCDNYKTFFETVIGWKFITLCVGQLLFGYLSDVKGRYFVLVILITGLTFTNIAMLLTTNLTLISMFLLTLFCFNNMTQWIIFMKENLQQSVFTVMVTLTALKFEIVGASIGWAYELTHDWKILHSIIVGLAIFGLIIAVFILTESPDYLVSMGKEEESVETFKYIEKFNSEQTDWRPSPAPKTVEDANQSFFRLFLKDQSFTKDFFLLLLLRISEKFTSHSLFVNLEILDSNLLLTNQVFYGSAAVGSICGGFVAYKWGRVLALKITTLICIIAFLLTVLCFEYRHLKFIFFGISSFGNFGFATVSHIYIPEVFPMNARSTASSICTVIANLVCVWIPFVIHDKYSLFIHFSLFGVSFLITFFCKETLEKKIETKNLEEETESLKTTE